MRAALYARFSSDRQNTRSCADQVAALRAWCEGQDWTVVEVYQDEGISGRELAGRQAWQRMLAEAPSGRFDVVLVEDLDRWARDFFGSFDAWRQLYVAGVRIATPSRGIVDFEDTGDQIRLALDASLSAEYSRKLSVHTKRGLAARVGVVSKAGGRAPYGYRADPVLSGDGQRVEAVRLEIDEPAAGVVRELFRLRVEERLGYLSLARRLQADGHPSPTGRAWSAATVRSILANRRYCGDEVVGAWKSRRDPATGKKTKRRTDEEVRIIPDTHPAIIDRDTFESSRVRSGVRTTQRQASRLAGLVWCAQCGRSVTRYGRAPYLRCSSVRSAQSCGSPSVREDVILDGLRSWLSSGDRGAAQALGEILDGLAGRREEIAAKVQRLERALADLERRAGRLAVAIAEGGSLDALVRQLRETQDERDRVQAELEATRASAAIVPDREQLEQELRSHPVEHWLTPANLRRLVSSLRVRLDRSVEVRTTVETVVWLGVPAGVYKGECPGAGTQVVTHETTVAVLVAV